MTIEPSASTSFDRIADRYEATRGGLERGREFAAVLDAHLQSRSRVLEVGVGTGAVAFPLATLGHRVVGVDISGEMLALARDRLPGRLARADATTLPVAAGTVDAVVAVWAVHVVGDRHALAAEVRRVLRPGGRLLVVAATPEVEPNDLTDIAFRFGPALGRLTDRTEQLAPVLAGVGLAHRLDTTAGVHAYRESPEERAAMIERRDWSSLWDLDEATWAAVVQPVIDDLRSLPNPDLPRACVHRHVLSVYEAGSPAQA